MRHELEVSGQQVELQLTRNGSGYLARFGDGQELRVAHWTPGHLLLEDGTSVEYARGGESVFVLGEELKVRPAGEGSEGNGGGESDGRVTAPMNGQVVKLLKPAGQSVARGEVILVLEAMKMENEVVAPVEGLLEAVHVGVGQTVSPGEMLFVVTKNGES